MKEEPKLEIVTHDLDDGRYLGHVVLVLGEFIHEEESVVDEACHAFAKSYHRAIVPETLPQYDVRDYDG